jgi:hypothetical protein
MCAKRFPTVPNLCFDIRIAQQVKEITCKHLFDSAIYAVLTRVRRRELYGGRPRVFSSIVSLDWPFDNLGFLSEKFRQMLFYVVRS